MPPVSVQSRAVVPSVTAPVPVPYSVTVSVYEEATRELNVAVTI